ncbi:serine hydrolase domain-containing protein [Paenibacillus sp. G2S3]|uniref:serine hydrolase domain-containing protein n=1 Tax=Paenibacillus sp. G2S3 TaxID=3047872 RepID=UPI0024C1573C|nr:serine hydrolase domain-containing protein [Paenibacillus sp. G2S3]WHY20200.1 serine hydrolase domain-containing protein [Paenibacillus sp. G2S3]
MLTSIKKRLIAGLTLLAVISAGLGASLVLPGKQASAETKTDQTALTLTQTEAPANLDDTESLTTFVDGIMEKDMNRLQIPGAVISIVKDDKIILAKGYGSSNLEAAAPVDPTTSMFRIASTTKLFTWTAVMQLVEQGKIDLDTDINIYLKSVKIPATYPEPITMRHLMTHTAGFEEGGVGYQITTDPAKLPGSISETLNKHRLARVRPPGQISSYSNYGATLAGLIVEEVSGVPYNDYIKKYIFDPLDMKYSTVVEPLPESFMPNKVVGYKSENGSFIPGTPTFEGGFRPAGSGTVSAVDMAHFMIAHLQNGKYGDQQILRPETAELMHSTAFQFDKRLPGVDLGFAEKQINGLTLITHGGSDPMFNTGLYLVPAKHVGIFVSYNGGEGGDSAEDLIQAFFNRYYPAPDVSQPEFIASDESIQKYAGAYQFTRRNISDIDKFFNFFAQLNVSVEDNKLSLGSGSEQQLYREVGPNLFQLEGGTEQIAFRTNDSGKVTHMILGMVPDMPLERTPLLDQNKFWLIVLGFLGLIFITSLLGLIFSRRKIKAMTPPEKWAIRLSAGTAGWALLSFVTIFMVVMSMDMMQKFSGISLSLSLSLVMPIILVGLTLALLISAILVWKNKYWTAFKRVHYTLVALSAVAMTLFFYYWNLLGWQFG